MNSIFYDLETSGLNSINQILTYSFFVLDDNWKLIKKLSNSIKIARTQLPSVVSIVSNQIDVLEHQEHATETEREASKAITSFIWSVIKGNRDGTNQTPLIGFNSFKFDWPFLRTTLIRNGFNPYFYGKIVHRDIHSVVSKLYCTNKVSIVRGDGRLLKFENIYKNLLGEEYFQKHTSDQDVADEIRVAKYLAEEHGLDVRTYNAFEPEIKQNTVTKLDIDHETGEVKRTKFVRHQTQKNSSLWIDCSKSEGKKESLRWFNHGTSTFLIEDGSEIRDKTLCESFGGYNLDNYFEDNDSDIEQKIAAIGYKAIDILHAAIFDKDLGPLQELDSPEMNSLYNRNLLAHTNKKFDKAFEEYIYYRYGGKMLLQKFDIESEKLIVYPHPTYDEMCAEIEEYDDEILIPLKKYYENSDIKKVFSRV